MEVLVYGFARGPGQLPEVMNVACGHLHLKLRALSETPSFDGFDAVVLPFDTYHPWDRDGAAADRLTELHVRAGVAVHRAVAAGAAVVFIYQDCFAHYPEPGELAARSLGGMVLAELGLSACPLPGPEDGLQVLAPAFEPFLRRFGISESYLEVQDSRRELQPLCRTRDRLLTGVAAREGRGALLLLPGEPRRRSLAFFSSLGEGLAHFRAGVECATGYLFAEERTLLQEREEARKRLGRLEDRLERFRRCRDLLAASTANPGRRLPEWFATFLGMKLSPAGEEEVFVFESGVGGVAGRLSLGGDNPAHALLALSEGRQEPSSPPCSPGEIPVLLFLHDGMPQGRAGECLRAAARDAGVGLLEPVDLLKLVEENDLAGTGSRLSPQALVRVAVRRSADPPGL
ncbi:MAG: hypothetical protein E2P00_07165 [Acidobacteria bacterium]|nr:MAG: hypothetical protein E2P00_07165 [Acidobacteriota bacterium]